MPDKPLRPGSPGRRDTSSRQSRPRRVAGRGAGSPAESADGSEAPEVSDDRIEPVESGDERVSLAKQTEAPESSAEVPAVTNRGSAGLIALVAVIVLLVGVLGAQAYYLFGPPADPEVVSTERPVLIGQTDVDTALSTAREAAEAAIGREWQSYDENVDAATAFMTEEWAAEYRTVTDDVRDSFIEGEINVTVTVLSAGIMTASEERAEVLLFLNQFVTRADGNASGDSFRVNMSLERADDRWLVDNIDTE